MGGSAGENDESHTHESEQITMVIEGVLHFQQGDEVIGVKAGEAIAIPSNAPHAVYNHGYRSKSGGRVVSGDGQVQEEIAQNTETAPGYCYGVSS